MIERHQLPPVPRLVKIIPPLWCAIFIAISACINMLYPWREILNLRVIPFGSIFLALGITNVIWPAILFNQRGTEILPASPTNKLLMTDGPFKQSRNPMYLGMLCLLLGIAFFVGTLPMFLAPIAFFCIINFVFIPFEEAKMLRQFGEQYEDYRRSVRRWIGW